MASIERKIWPESFQAILDGRKTFEIRLDDFEIHEGDVLSLKEWDPKARSYTGRTLGKRVGYIRKTKDLPFWPHEEIESKGLQVISLLDVAPGATQDSRFP